MLSRAALLLALAAPGQAAWQWIKSESKPPMCAAIRDPCGQTTGTGDDSCTVVAVGPCDAGKTSASRYITIDNMGFALVKSADTYLLNGADVTANLKVLEPAVGAIKGGYMDSAQIEDSSEGTKFAFIAFGDVYSEHSQDDLQKAAAKTWAYMGTASYFNTGTKTISGNSNILFLVDDINKNARKDNKADDFSDSDIGAPSKVGVCISKATATKTCGAARTWESGAYKFSIFGLIKGDKTNYDALKGTNTRLGTRQKLCVHGSGVSLTNFKVNGQAYSKANSNTLDVTKLAFQAGNDTVTIDFPTDYNYGDVKATKDANGITDWSADSDTNVNTDTVKIRVTEASTTCLHVDFLFDATKLGDNMFFVYDPTVKGTAPPAPTPSGVAPLAVSFAASVLAALF